LSHRIFACDGAFFLYIVQALRWVWNKKNTASPSLLPKYPGLNTYQKALDAGDREHGTTVHFVNEEVDNGAIILQAKVPIFDNDTVEVIEARTREQEYRIYLIVVKWFMENRLKLQNGVAYLDDIPLPEQGYANN